jgi:hypothetical protein
MTDAASDLALTPGDPTQTIHFKIAVALNQMLTYTGSSVRAFPTKHELAEQAGSDDPALRREYLIEASLSWILIGWASALVVAVFAVVTGALFGHGAGNTSFNGPGEPIVSSVADAVACFRRLGLDFLVLDDELLASDGGWWRRRA